MYSVTFQNSRDDESRFHDFDDFSREVANAKKNSLLSNPSRTSTMCFDIFQQIIFLKLFPPRPPKKKKEKKNNFSKKESNKVDEV